MTANWFDQLPTGWLPRRVKTISPVMRGASPRPIDDPIYFDDEGDFAWVRISDVTASNGRLLETTQCLSDLGASKSVKLQPGELFLSIAGSVGKPCITGIKACIHDGFVYFPYLPKVSQKYLFWIFEGRECFSGLGKLGTQLNLNTETVGNISIPFPPLKTQKSIADFLDREIARIDQLIEKKKWFLSLVSNRIEALVDRAISNQEVPRIRFENAVQRMQRPVVLSDHDELTRLGLYNRGRGIFKKPATDEEGMGVSDFFFVKSGDLILSGQFAWEGAIAIATQDEEGCVVSHRYPVYKGRDGVNTAYLLGLLRSSFGDFLLNEASRGSAGRNRPLNTWRLGKEKIPVPDTALQSDIADAIGFERRLRKKIEASIAILKEFRAALITAAVTGRIDVESWDKAGHVDRRLDDIEEAMAHG